MLSQQRRGVTRREHLVVELKRPNVTIAQTEVGQIKSYADAVATDPQFHAIEVRVGLLGHLDGVGKHSDTRRQPARSTAWPDRWLGQQHPYLGQDMVAAHRRLRGQTSVLQGSVGIRRQQGTRRGLHQPRPQRDDYSCLATRRRRTRGHSKYVTLSDDIAKIRAHVEITIGTPDQWSSDDGTGLCHTSVMRPGWLSRRAQRGDGAGA